MEAYIIFEGNIEPEATSRLIKAIKDNCRPDITKINILFSSLGGSIYEGFLIATVIQNSKTPILIHATNHIDSIANVIYLSAPERTSESYAKFYMHGASTSGGFDEKALQDQLTSIKTHNTRIAYFISENSNLHLQRVQQMMTIGTTISAQKALEYDMVQQITHKEVPKNINHEEIIYIN